MFQIKRIAALLFCALVALSLLPLPASAAKPERKVVRVGWYESAYNQTGEAGRLSGYAYEYQLKLAAYTGWTYEYVKGGWPDLLEMLEAGKIDLMSDVSYTDERAERMLFPSLPMGTEEYYLFVAPDREDITPLDAASLNGKRVGVNKSSFQERLFLDWAERNGVKAKLVEVTGSEDESLRMLGTGELDGYVTVDAFADVEDAVPAFKIGSSDFFFAVSKSRPDLLAELDYALNRVQDENRYYNQQMFEKHIKHVGANTMLTTEEKDWLAAHGTIRVGYLDNYLAFCAKDAETGELTGALAEFLDLASDCIKNAALRFDAMPYETTQDALDALQNGEIDCLFPISLSPYDTERLGVLVTEPLAQTELYAAVRSVSLGVFTPRYVHTAAVSTDNLSHQTFLADNFPGWTLCRYDSAEDCFKAVKEGFADCTLISNYRLTRSADLLEKYGLSTVTTGVSASASFALRGGDTALYGILNKAVAGVPSSAVNAALTSYSVVAQSFGVRDYLRAHILAVVTIPALTLFGILVLLLRAQRSEKKALASERKAREALDHIEVLNGKLSARQGELKEALSAAEQASRAKTAFLNNMSHDIRTPMNAIIGFTTLAKTHLDDPEQVLGDIDKISAASRHLLSLINDVLDMSRIESGRLTLRDEPFSFRELLDEINTVIGGQCADKGLTYEFRVLGDVRASYYGDDLKLRQVLINVLGNAVKFTPAPGTVSFTAEQVAACDNLCTLRFVSKDTGVGMDESFIPKIFDAFSQENDRGEKRYGSTGLGMAISKSIVERMNGDIKVESEKGVGSTFTVTVTLRDAGGGALASEPESEAKKTSETEARSLAGLRVLIVEDMEINAELLADLLELEDIESDWAENGKIGVERFEQSEVGWYDAVLMDVRMPVMDGLEATAAIRALPKADAKTVPIIAMSANAFAEDVQRSLLAGMNAHLSKPVDPDKLYETLRELTEAKP